MNAFLQANLLTVCFPLAYCHSTQILADIIFNALAITACFLAAGMTGVYGTAVQLDNYDQLQGGWAREAGGVGHLIQLRCRVLALSLSSA